MADLVLTHALVVPGAGATFLAGIAGQALTAGLVCQIEAGSTRVTLTLSGTLELARVHGIASHAASPGQPLRLQTGGQLSLGAALLTVGEVYVLSRNGGMIAPVGDLLPGAFVTLLGIAYTTSVLGLSLWSTGIQRA